MKLYKVVWNRKCLAGNLLGIGYFEVSSCQAAREYLLQNLPEATKIAVRPHYGERPW